MHLTLPIIFAGVLLGGSCCNFDVLVCPRHKLVLRVRRTRNGAGKHCDVQPARFLAVMWQLQVDDFVVGNKGLSAVVSRLFCVKADHLALVQVDWLLLLHN